MKPMQFDGASFWWSDFRRGLLAAFGLYHYNNRFQLLSDRIAKPTWEVVGEALADAMNEYGANVLKTDPGATLPQRAKPVAGSLPDPDILAHYERLSAGSADRILAMAENKLHQRTGELAAEHRIFVQPCTLGFLSGTVAVLCVLLISFWLASVGQWLPGMAGILLVATISAVQFRGANVI